MFSQKCKNVPSVLTVCLSLHSLPNVRRNPNKSIIIMCEVHSSGHLSQHAVIIHQRSGLYKENGKFTFFL